MAHFSLTRAGGLVAVAVGTFRVGIDAEPHRPGTGDLLDAPVFSPTEQAWLRTQPGRFLDLWVAKEAIGKLSGLGLLDADRVRGKSDSQGWRPAVDALGRNCWLTPLTLPDMAAAALATYDGPLASRSGTPATLGISRWQVQRPCRPAARMSRHTRFRPTFVPRAASSAQTRRTPGAVMQFHVDQTDRHGQFGVIRNAFTGRLWLPPLPEPT